jgi:diketogulonate reductase-like aldo/keto reductase
MAPDHKDTPRSVTVMPTVALPDGERIPVLGIGTWNVGDDRHKRADEIASLRMAVDLGMTVVDTAEMYGNGASEAVIAEALATRRHEIFLVSKVLPQHATKRGTIAACEASLRRLKTDRLDLYLLHWRGSVPLADTVDAFEALVRDGKIRHWGVSNFDTGHIDELVALPDDRGSRVAMNQVLYNLMRRGIEYDLLPWCRGRSIPTMAYSPLEQGRLLRKKTLQAVANRLRATPAQVALAWILRQPDVVAIPKTGHVDRVRENYGALSIKLAGEDLAELDWAFPPTARKVALEML